MKDWLYDSCARIRADLGKAHRSLTIWFNGAVGMVAVALPYAQDSLPQLQPFLDAGAYRVLMGGVVLGNILLRFRTSQRLADK